MLNQRRWKFGALDLVTSNFAVPARELVQFQRVETIHQFTYLLEKWLGDPGYRRALLEIERECTAAWSSALLGRQPGPDEDKRIVVSLRSAFTARRLHVLNRMVRLSSDLVSGSGKSWKFEGSQIVQSDCSIRTGELAEYYLIKGSISFSQDVKAWLQDSKARRLILDVHQSVASLNSPQQVTDTKIVEDLIEAWQRREIYLLRRRIEGGSGGETELAVESVAPGSQARKTDTKLTWIQVVMVDEDDVPMPGIRYRMRITDGSTREGTLDSAGSVRVNGIDPGTCEVTFPDLDAREWHRV